MVAALHSSDGPNIRFKWGEGAADGVRICVQMSNVECKVSGSARVLAAQK